ncbi:MAG: DUF4893 domain-containing protein [Devosiaceae bacterium]|nr:DUF4893 domain-containing protein [Devosiaceae bacterium]
MKKLKIALVMALAIVSHNGQAAEVACTIPDGFKVQSSDALRMARLETTRSLGLAAALQMKSAAERKIISDLFVNEFSQIEEPERLIGNYACRTIKLGGSLPGVVYGWFDCEIFPEDASLVIRKTSGSQRFLGLLKQGGDGLAYRGALSYGYEDTMTLYGQNQERNQVGCVSALNSNMDHFVLELPQPVFESVHDVIELKRR